MPERSNVLKPLERVQPKVKQPHRRMSKKKLALLRRRISNVGEDLLKQLRAGWVEVNLAPLVAADVLVFAERLARNAGHLETLRLQCYPREFDREEQTPRQRGSRKRPHYQYNSPEHQALVKSTSELLVCERVRSRLAGALKTALDGKYHLQELALGVNLSVGTWTMISNAIGAHTGLHKVSFAGSALGDSNLLLLSEGLRNNLSIRELDLAGCSITDSGVAAIVGVIKAATARRAMEEWHEALREYPDLSLAPGLRRRVYRERRQQIASLVKTRCGGLLLLNLADNQISDKGALELAAAIRADATMIILGLRGNRLTSESEAELAELLRRHKSLLRIDLRQNGSPDMAILKKQLGRGGKRLRPTRAPSPALTTTSTQDVELLVAAHEAKASETTTQQAPVLVQSLQPPQQQPEMQEAGKRRSLESLELDIRVAKMEVMKAELLREVADLRAHLHGISAERARADEAIAHLAAENKALKERVAKLDVPPQQAKASQHSQLEPQTQPASAGEPAQPHRSDSPVPTQRTQAYPSENSPVHASTGLGVKRPGQARKSLKRRSTSHGPGRVGSGCAEQEQMLGALSQVLDNLEDITQQLQELCDLGS
ncbi:hypothetical protein WJX72_011466 [[Myrmecia] bisecta]|uniref:Uncharacterized protein n=1 Tax=[Myrmecia] bisecta TaxID=41462 RepID=A0AAW1Q216_9CHLO